MRKWLPYIGVAIASSIAVAGVAVGAAALGYRIGEGAGRAGFDIAELMRETAQINAVIRTFARDIVAASPCEETQKASES